MYEATAMTSADIWRSIEQKVGLLQSLLLGLHNIVLLLFCTFLICLLFRWYGRPLGKCVDCFRMQFTVWSTPGLGYTPAATDPAAGTRKGSQPRVMGQVIDISRHNLYRWGTDSDIVKLSFVPLNIICFPPVSKQLNITRVVSRHHTKHYKSTGMFVVVAIQTRAAGANK